MSLLLTTRAAGSRSSGRPRDPGFGRVGRRKLGRYEDDAPKATDADRSWREVLLAATLQGAIFGLVKAAVDRGTAEGTCKVTGVSPGEEGQ
jgi:Protein of unknown function (DUF4235)